MTTIMPIEDSGALQKAVSSLQEERCIAIDTEFMREKTYYPELCLVQVASGNSSFCLDAIKLDSLDELKPLMEGHANTWIFHSCRQDLEVLELSLGIIPASIYDTQLAAAFCGYGEQVSYSSLVESICGITLKKDQTRTDWSKRPLSMNQLQYAMDDVRYLVEVKNALDSHMQQLGRKEWFDQECSILSSGPGTLISPQDAWQRVKGGGRLPIRAQALVRGLAEWRERKAQKRNRPREWILPTRVILDICTAEPRSVSGLSEIESVNDGVVRYSGREIIAALQDAAVKETENIPVWPSPRRLDKPERDRARQIMAWIRNMSEEAGLSQSLLANRSDVEQFVSGKTDIPLFRGWRYEFAGKQVLAEFSQA